MASQPIDDAAQRRRALDIGESFIVQAPAGSGKTELLTQRFLRLLASVDHPEEVCAITFTRKAAAEMRHRIIDALAGACGDAPREPHRRTTWALASAALARDHDRAWRLLDNPNRLRIQTFDALAHALARQMPLLSQLGAPPQVGERSQAHYREAARATLRMLDDPALGADIERLLSHLDSRQAQLEALLCAMLARRDQWLGHALSSPDTAALTAALDDAVTEHLRQLATATGGDRLHQLVVVAQAAGVCRIAGGEDADGPSSIAAWGERDAPPCATWADLPAWQGLARLLFTGDGKQRSAWNARIGFPAAGEKGIDADEKQRRADAKQAIKALVESLAEERETWRLWAGLATLPSAGPDPSQQALLGSLLRVLLHAAAELNLVFQAHAEVDFVDIQLRALRALGEPGQPTDLALMLDYRLRHLLVDEFQDTSSSQYALLASLTGGWQPGDGRTLFAVGDPMQSIYRFREAEVGLYLAAREHGIGGLRLTPLTLTVNFRSRATIVDWVNRHFPTIMPPRIDIGRGAVPYSPASAFDQTPDTDAVQVHAFGARDDMAEAATVVALVGDALRATPDGNIAVLARARSHLRAIATALKAAGLAFQAVEIDPLAEQAVVRDLHALTRALLHPGDRLAWLVVLHSPWIGLTLDDLLRLAEPSRRTLLARLRDPQLRATLSADGACRVERLLAVLDARLPWRGHRPLRQSIEGVWLGLGGLAAGDDADAQAFLALLEAHEQAGDLADFGRLDEALAQLYALPDSQADGRVQLMTMHKAKGLEFDTVILPGLGRAPRAGDSALLYWQQRTDYAGESQLLMAPIRAAGQDAEPISNYLRACDKDRDRLEQTRLLYVAATRAKRRLHLLAHARPGDDTRPPRPTTGSLLEHLWPAVAPAFAALSAPIDSRQVTASPPPPLRRLAADWRPTPMPVPPAVMVPRPATDNAVEFLWAGDTARLIGTLVHRQLERIAKDGVEHWPVERAAELRDPLRHGLRQLGVEPSALDAATAKALRALRNTLGDDTGRWILGHHADAHCEWPLTVDDGTPLHCVIDRSFVDDQGVRWIIDYKTGDHLDGDSDAFLDREQQRYRPQLETYARIVRLLEPRPIRLALYFPLFADWRVWDYPA